MKEEDKRGTNGNGANGQYTDGNDRQRVTSAKQIEANRRNAKLSRGARTPEGKRASSRNALKYGLRSGEIVLEGREDPTEFEELFAALCNDFSPQGYMETDLVREVAITMWKLRRLRWAELGETRFSLANAMARPTAATALRDLLLQDAPGELLSQNIAGIDHMIGAVEKAQTEYLATGTLSEETCQRLDRVVGKVALNPSVLFRLRSYHGMGEAVAERGNDIDEPAVGLNGATPKVSVAMLEEFEQCLRTLEKRRRELRQKEKEEQQIAIQRSNIPTGPAAELFQRYETSLKRDLQRTIVLLERLQRRRKGEAVPPR